MKASKYVDGLLQEFLREVYADTRPGSEDKRQPSALRWDEPHCALEPILFDLCCLCWAGDIKGYNVDAPHENQRRLRKVVDATFVRAGLSGDYMLCRPLYTLTGIDEAAREFLAKVTRRKLAALIGDDPAE